MSKTSNILLILLTCISLSACQEDDFRPAMEQAPDMESVIAQGKYLAARNAETYSAIVDPEKGTWFPIGTPFHLLAFTKPYVKDDPDYEKDPANYNYATTPRFNEVAWEGEILVYGDTIRYINVNDTPDKLFGFTALTSADGSLSEEKGDAQDNLVALDFYGFTYGKKVDSRDNYIPLDKINGIEPLDEAGNGNPTDPSILDELKRTESVSADGESLNDLLRGALFNRDIHNAGISDNIATQSILPFKHCFSKLQFMVVQQPKDNDAESEDKKDNIDFNNSTEPSFDNLYVEDVKVTGTYGSGSVYLKDGKVELSGNPIDRPLKIKDSYKGPVTTTQVEIGEMILFPSANSALKGKESTPDGGYALGLEITVRCPEKKTLENFIRNTSGREPLDNEIEPVTVDDKEYYRCTVKKDKILNSNYDDIDNGNDIVPLYLKQNTSYTIVIAFQKDAVRIITVIPLVEQWLQGEGTPEDPWQDQALGQPQMFDNIVWSDRNLGADHYNPETDFEKTIGYFYQSGRNIPYYPFDTKEYYTLNNGQAIRIPGKEFPSPEDSDNSILANVEDAANSTYMFYPIVDKRLLTIYNTNETQWYGGPKNCWIWTINTEGKKPQLSIPEKMPVDIIDEKPVANAYFDFVRQNGQYPTNENFGLTSEYDMHWEQGLQNQPTSGAWVIPSSDDFMSIFPSTPHAGNITFRGGGDNSAPMNGWGNNTTINSQIETIRVTVPFYNPNDDTEEKDNNAWKILKEYETDEDGGTTKLDYYTKAPNWNHNLNYEPKGDPEENYASVYVISRKKEPDWIPENQSYKKLPDNLNFTIKEWGTIYAIKRVYTSQAYRMRWRTLYKLHGDNNDKPGIYIEICRYRCKATDHLNETNYMTYDWDHPAAKIYFPICGLGDWTGQYINFGTECQYATRDIINADNKTSALQMKITGDDTSNAYIAIVKNVINRNFAKQIRPVVGGVVTTSK